MDSTTIEEDDVATIIKRRKHKREGTRPIWDKLARLNGLARDVAALAEMANQPPPAVRDRLVQAVGQAHATIGQALDRLRAVEPAAEGLAEMPQPDADGYYPAAQTLRAIIAHQIAERRRKAGLSQVELARRAGVRQETVSRLESGKHAPTVRTVEKIDRALSKAGA
jgi:HTH-type transcriptional regulator/antitoxin HipB